MARLRNSETGVVVNVSEATAVRMGAAWVPFGSEPKPAPKKRAPRRGRKPATEKPSNDDE